MRQTGTPPTTASDIAHDFSKTTLPTGQETLGQIVVEILLAGKQLNRKALCVKLLTRLELSSSPEEEQHYQKLIGLLFGR
ncbi:regulatory protein YcgZ [Candidatus Pantoea persica]|uniref:regulatory protein YcgZ n=1 Tax=Candidatus Pantoea persica TaxID=2518128 RepID=UPI00215DB113|nr:regulatory protein YcgZ [Candidatus Pantoea persica]MBA2814577.1 putative two-component-system connector protein YcgZ [Candidatus Pantoea persica]